VDTWTSLNGSSSVYQNWPGGLVEGLLFEYGLFDTTPLKNYLRARYVKGINRNITVGATNFNDGKFYQFSETEKDILEGIVCSASPPLFFPHQRYKGSVYADGGCLVNLDYFGAVNRCKEIAEKYSDITVDLIFDNKPTEITNKNQFTTIGVHNRVKEIQNYDKTMWLYYRSLSYYPEVNFRYVLEPSKTLPNGKFSEVPLDFKKEDLEAEIQLGKEDANRAIEEKQDAKLFISLAFQETREVIYP